MEMEYIVHPSDIQESPGTTQIQTQPKTPTLSLALSNPKSDSHQSTSPVAAATKPPRKRQHSRAEAAYPRKRAIQACRTCRLRRTKCDNSRPACGKCAGLGVECIYQENDHSTFDPASLTILQRLDDLEELLRKNATTVPQDQNDSLTSPSVSLSIPKTPAPQSLERPAEWRPSYINIETVLTWPVFDDQNFDERLDLRSLLRSDKNHAASPTLPIPADFGLYAAGQLLQQFLDNVHIFNPILEEAKVREYMRAASFNGLGWDAQSCLLLLIYALGSISDPYGNLPKITASGFRQSPEFLQAESFFFAAQNRMGMLLCGSGIIEAQCFFLAGVYLMATLRPIEAWKMFVQALACCQAFSPQLSIRNARTEEESRMEQSIYWTCFKSELELRLELNVSEKSVWDLTYPALFPSPPEGLKSQGEAMWFFYLAEIALRRLGNRILNYIYRYDSSVDSDSNIEDAILDFEGQADGWLQSLPAALSLETTNPEHKQYAALRFILNGHLLDCNEMMYWHFVADAVHGRIRGSSTEAFVRKGLQVCVQRVDINEKGFYHRHHGTWLMLRSCTRSALVLLATARCSDLVSLMPEGWEEAVAKVMAMLGFWKGESRDVMDRLQILETLVGGVAPGILKNR
ncbi:hypothetical protein VE00_09758 [Pseudogymnoascus sp. WSF 3629]|nr:hypothetical protein VE00_09758 [Pseudogymnoascus sp. WSF 3629]